MQAASIFESIRPRYPEFKDQVALITGSSRGIGKGIALRLAREGMKIVLHGMDAAEVDNLTQEIQALGVQAIGVQADFTSPDSVQRLFDETLNTFGALDLLVNNAADLRRTNFSDADMSLFDHQIAVNLRAPYECALLAARLMQPRQRGNIVNISSVGGIRAHWRGLPYDVTKGGIDSMTQSMAIELAKDGIRVNAIAPGAIHREGIMLPEDPHWRQFAERVPQARFGTPLEIGAAVAFLASDDAAYITGTVLYVDGGLTAQLSPPTAPI